MAKKKTAKVVAHKPETKTAAPKAQKPSMQLISYPKKEKAEKPKK